MRGAGQNGLRTRQTEYGNEQARCGRKNFRRAVKGICRLSARSFDGRLFALADPCDEEFTEAQEARFELLCARVKAVAPDATVHLSASGGFLKGLYYDMVRIGILLYGYAPFPNAFSCRPIMRVTAPVIACRYVRRAERVFYGKQLKQKNGYLSVLRYGYADGLPRSDGFFRCMDASAVEKREKIGKECDILKKNANEIAQKCGTISYEVLVNAARRAEKIYLE